MPGTYVEEEKVTSNRIKKLIQRKRQLNVCTHFFPATSLATHDPFFPS